MPNAKKQNANEGPARLSNIKRVNETAPNLLGARVLHV